VVLEVMSRVAIQKTEHNSTNSEGEATGLVPGFYVVVEKLNDVFRRGAGQEDLGDALFLQLWQVFLRDDATDQNKNVIHPLFSK